MKTTFPAIVFLQEYGQLVPEDQRIKWSSCSLYDGEMGSGNTQEEAIESLRRCLIDSRTFDGLKNPSMIRPATEILAKDPSSLVIIEIE